MIVVVVVGIVVGVVVMIMVMVLLMKVEDAASWTINASQTSNRALKARPKGLSGYTTHLAKWWSSGRGRSKETLNHCLLTT